ncbi:SET domain containing protein [Perkinsela sp. CCAP 1560/4]|nr:SET domain containing protein [Perkinsela sp. CCAP 1560/4]|eukprot:KNH08150.1 SET domain containing protein [Perkinsela sp. CCAP 1560/4]
MDCKCFAFCTSCIDDAVTRNLHKFECDLFCELPDEVREGDTDYLRFILRYCAFIQLNDPRQKAIDSLTTMRESQSAEFLRWAGSYASLIVTFFANKINVTEDELIDLLCRVQTNAFGFPFTQENTFGWSIQSTLSLLNHDCMPNCYIAPIDERSGVMSIRASKKILPGEELTIAYMQADGNATIRDELFDRYRFHCSCRMCTPAL